MGIKSVLERNAMLNFYLKDYTNKPSFIHKKVSQRLSDIFHQNSFVVIKAEISKLRTYATFKKEIGFERYLSEIRNPSVRIQVSKFRLSDHRLVIEVSRHNGIPKNELHFLLQCSLYKTQRANLINPLINMTHGFTYFTESQKLEYLLRNVESNISSYILLSKPKRRN